MLAAGKVVRHQQGTAVVDGPEVGRRTLDDPEAMTLEVQTADDLGMEQAYGVGGYRVAEPRMEFHRRRRTANVVVLFQNDDAETRLGELGCAGQPVVAAPDNGNIVFLRRHSDNCSSL